MHRMNQQLARHTPGLTQSDRIRARAVGRPSMLKRPSDILAGLRDLHSHSIHKTGQHSASTQHHHYYSHNHRRGETRQVEDSQKRLMNPLDHFRGSQIAKSRGMRQRGVTKVSVGFGGPPEYCPPQWPRPPQFEPDEPHLAPRPGAPGTASTTADEWTEEVTREFRQMSDYAKLLAASFLSKSRWYYTWYVSTVMIVALSQCGIIAAVAYLPDAEDGYGAGIIAAIALFFILLNTTFDFQHKRLTFQNASVQLMSLGNSTGRYLNTPFDQRSSPFALSVAFETKVNDIVNMAYGQPVELHDDIYTPIND